MIHVKEAINLLRAHDPKELSELQLLGTALGVSMQDIAGPLGGKHAKPSRETKAATPTTEILKTVEAEETEALKRWYFEVEAVERALGVLRVEGSSTLDELRRKVSDIDHVRLIAECCAAVMAFFASSGAAPDFWPRVLAGLGCLSAVLSALIPRLATSDSGQGQSWASHYSELVDTLAKADTTYRRLTIWLRVYAAHAAVSDPTADIQSANALCESVIRRKLLLKRPDARNPEAAPTVGH